MEQNPLLHKNLIALNLSGMWSPKNPKLKILYAMYSKFIFFFFVGFVLTQCIEIIYIYTDFEEITANAGVTLVYGVLTFKVYTVIFNKEKVVALVDKIRETELEILSQNDEKLKQILHDYVAQNWSISSRFWIVCFVTCMSYVLMPICQLIIVGPEEILLENGTFSGHYKKPLVFSSWFPFDKYDKHFIIAYGIQSAAGTIGSLYVAVWDTFIIALMIFAIGQFQILQYYLQNLNPHNDNTNDSQIQYLQKEERINTKFIKCVTHHQMIIKYVKDLDNLISLLMFFDFLKCSLMLCAVGLQSLLMGMSPQLLKIIEYLMALLIQLFMYYWHANEILLESLKVADAAWRNCWYDCNTNIQKGLIMIIIRAQKPCILTAGKFYTMSLETFVMILRTSYTFLTVFQQLLSRENK